MTTLPAPATIAGFHARYPAPLTLQSAARILIERSGSSSRFEHLQIYRVLSVPQHSTPHVALNFAANTALCSQLQLFPSARELLDAGPDAMVDAGCSHIFYSALADLLREADDSRISARHQPVTPAKQGLSPSCPTRPVDASAYGSTPYKAPRFLPLPSFARPRVLPQARIVPNQLTLSMVSPFLLVVLSLRDQVPAQRLRFSLYPRRTQVVTRAGRFESEDNGGFEFIGRDCTDHRRWAALECKPQWNSVLDDDDDEAGTAALRESQKVLAKQVSKLLALVATHRSQDGDRCHKRFFLVVANNYYLQLKWVEFSPEYLDYIFPNPAEQTPQRSPLLPCVASPSEECGTAEHSPAQDLPFMTLQEGPIHDLSTASGRLAAAQDILGMAQEMEAARASANGI